MEESSLVDSEREKIQDELHEKVESLAKALEREEKLKLENESLEDMLDGLRKEQLMLVENYEQENYSLKNRLALHEKLALQYDTSLNEETEKWKNELSHLEERLHRQHNTELTNIRQQLDHINSELHQEKLVSTQRLETIALKNERIDKLNKDLRAARTSLNDTLQFELVELSNENSDLKFLVEEKNATEHELTQTIQQLRESLESAKMKEENLKYEKESMQTELSSSYQMLESCREEQCRLRDQLCASQNVGVKAKGNSLFAELEDKRVYAEKKLVGLASKCKCLQKHNEQLQHHVLKLKLQIAAMIETRSKTTDDKLIQSLDDALSNCRDENLKLLEELKRAQEKADSMEDVRNHQLGDSSAIAKLLESELKMKNTELAKVQEELRLSKIYAMIESRKVSDLQKQLFETGKLLDVAKSAKYRLQLEFDNFKSECGKESNQSQERTIKKEALPTENIDLHKTATGVLLQVIHEQRVSRTTEETEDQESSNAPAMDSDKENEAPPDSSRTDNDSTLTKHVEEAKLHQNQRLPLSEKAILPDRCGVPSGVSKFTPTKQGKHQCTVGSRREKEGKSEKLIYPRKPGFENTIDTSKDECKQQ